MLAAVAIVGTACPCEEVYTGAVDVWDAALSGQEEVPPPNPASTAAGSVEFALRAGGDSMSYAIYILSMPASAITQAHLHQAVAGVNVP